jgi:hypothetical protein
MTAPVFNERQVIEHSYAAHSSAQCRCASRATCVRLRDDTACDWVPSRPDSPARLRSPCRRFALPLALLSDATRDVDVSCYGRRVETAVAKVSSRGAVALIAIALSGCGSDDEDKGSNTAGMGGAGGTSATAGSGGAGASSGGTSAGSGGAGGSASGAGGSSSGAGGSAAAQAGGGSGGGGATGCMRVPSSDAICIESVPEAPQAHSCADRASGRALDDSHDNTCWNGNFVPGAMYAYCCPP